MCYQLSCRNIVGTTTYLLTQQLARQSTCRAMRYKEDFYSRKGIHFWANITYTLSLYIIQSSNLIIGKPFSRNRSDGRSHYLRAAARTLLVDWLQLPRFSSSYLSSSLPHVCVELISYRSLANSFSFYLAILIFSRGEKVSNKGFYASPVAVKRLSIGKLFCMSDFLNLYLNQTVV